MLMKVTIFFILLGITTVVGAIVIPVRAQENGNRTSISITPPLSEIVMQPGRSITQAFTIANDGTVDLEVIPTIVDFSPDENTGAPIVFEKNENFPYAQLQNLDKKFEEKTGIDLNDQRQKEWAEWLKHNVAWVDSYALDPKFWRNVGRKLLSLTDPIKRAKLLAEYSVENLENIILGKVSEELKEVINGEKKEKAVEIADAHASLTLPAAIKAKIDIPVHVDLAVKAVKPDLTPLPKPTSAQISEIKTTLQLIAESEERQKKLRGEK